MEETEPYNEVQSHSPTMKNE
jgi:hypothetical protein